MRPARARSLTCCPQLLRRAAMTALLVALCLALSACEGGCGEDIAITGDGFAVGTAPKLNDEAAFDRGASVLVTAEGAQYVADRFEPLARTLLETPDGELIDLSEVLDAVLQEEDLEFGSVAIDDVIFRIGLPDEGGVRAVFLDDPARLRIEIDTLWLDVEATAINAANFASFACRIRGKLDPGTASQRMFTVKDVRLDLVMSRRNGPDGGSRYALSVADVDFTLDDSGIDVVADSSDPDYYCNYDVCQDGFSGCAECHAVCGGASLLEDVFNFFAAFFDTIIGRVIEVGASYLLDDFARLDGDLHPALLTRTLLPDTLDSQRLVFGLRPPARDAFEVASGPTPDITNLAVHAAVGTAPAAPHPCIGPDPGTPRFVPGPLPNATVGPDGLANGTHVVLALPDATLNQAIWSLYRAGTLCLQLTSDDIGTLTRLLDAEVELTAGTVSLLLPGLDAVVDKDTPLMLSIEPWLDPERPELVAFGAGSPDDSLLQVTLPRMGLALYAWVEGRYLRLFSAEAAIGLDVTPTPRPDGILDLSLDSVTVEDLGTTDNALFPDADLQALFGYVVELAVGVLLGQGLDLPLDPNALLDALLGLPVGFELTGLQRAGAGQDWLQIGARLQLAEPSPKPPRGALDTRLTVLQHAPPRVEVVAIDPATGEPVPEARVQLRADGGPWRAWRAPGAFTPTTALIALPGTHRLEARAQRPDDHRSIDLTPASTTLDTPQPATSPQPQATSDPPPTSAPAQTASGGCQQAPTRPSAPLPWAALGAVLGLAGLLRRRRRWALGAALLAGLGGLGCGDDAAPTQVIACAIDRDCPTGQQCGCAGVCYAPEVCADDGDCCAGERCSEGICREERACDSNDECPEGQSCSGCQCKLPRCTSDDRCGASERCVAGACVPSETFPCPFGCGPDEACVGELARCVPTPKACAGHTCADGEVRFVENAPAIIGPLCQAEQTQCGCAPAPTVGFQGEPAAYLAARSTPDGRIALAAYDVALGDVAVRWFDPSTETLEPPLYLDGLPEDASPQPADARGLLAEGPDVGAELDMQVSDTGQLALVYRDRTRRALRFAQSDDNGATWTRFDLDASGAAHLTPALAWAPSGGWVVAWQHTQPSAEPDTLDTALRVAIASTDAPTSSSDFTIADLASAQGRITYEDAPVGTGVTPALAHKDGRWFAIYHDAAQGTLAMTTWVRLTDPRTHVVLTPATRGQISGGATGLAPDVHIAPSGLFHAAYLDPTSGELRYGQWSYDAAADAVVEPAWVTVDAGLSGSPQRVLARDLVLRATPDGQRLLIAYQDTTFADLYLASAPAADASDAARWSSGPWASDGGVGFFPQAVMTSASNVWLFYSRWSFPGVGQIQQEVRAQPYALPR